MWEHPDTESSHKEFENAVRIFQDELEQRNGILQGGTLCAGSILCTLSVNSEVALPRHLLIGYR